MTFPSGSRRTGNVESLAFYEFVSNGYFKLELGQLIEIFQREHHSKLHACLIFSAYVPK